MVHIGTYLSHILVFTISGCNDNQTALYAFEHSRFNRNKKVVKSQKEIQFICLYDYVTRNHCHISSGLNYVKIFPLWVMICTSSLHHAEGAGTIESYFTILHWNCNLQKVLHNSCIQYEAKHKSAWQ